MNGTQWIIFILLVQVIHFAGTWKLYVKAGRKAWEAAIPIYNGIVLMKIINRPAWWVFLLFIPIINLLMFPVIWVETIRSFGKNKLLDTWLVILTLGFYTYYLNYVEDVQYIEDRSLKPRTGLGEWVSSIVFAIVAATFVHTYFIQPYVIPTGSLERTLRIGDFLFVSKMHYGARVPMTTVAAPMVHDTLPLLGLRSYLRKPQLPYMRLPKFQTIKKNDIVVFSWPADTVRQFFVAEDGVRKPIDKKSNYVKRCVGTPGDSMKIIDGIVYVNDKELQLSDRAKVMYDHIVYANNGVSSKLLTEVDATDYTRFYVPSNLNQNQLNALRQLGYQVGADEQGNPKIYTDEKGIPTEVIRQLRLSLKEETPRARVANMTLEIAESLRNNSGVDSVKIQLEPSGKAGYNIFPQNRAFAWNNDNFGPIYIPEEGKTIKLTPQTLPIYKKIIKDYEHNTLSVSGNQISINGEITDTYTFKQDYYWMMGDNRDHSEDSRTWGYVPANHIVGKPVFIWLSFDNFQDGIRFNEKPRWDRIFTTVGGSGEPVSYFKYFLMLLAGWFIFDFIRKRRKSKA
ncbi:MAG: signal peptidase I [Allomuricauda sp.]|nr:MAG: signal peptidase I [Allomuricauda sp.]